MKRISAYEFEAAVRLDPAWAAKLTEPVAITEPVELEKSPISHLSPLLHFIQPSPKGRVASFRNCPDLKIVEGNFHGRVLFFRCGIEKINSEKFVITQPDQDKVAAIFNCCPNLKVAEGTYPGFVEFDGSEIQEIDPKKLIITQNAKDRGYASFNCCMGLKVIKGHFRGLVQFTDSGVETVDMENFSISEPNPKSGHVIHLWDTPLEKDPKEMSKLIRCLGKKRSIQELKKIGESHPSQANISDAIDIEIEFRKKVSEIAKKKNNAVEFEIE